METSAPYNQAGMPGDDQTIVGAIRRQEERLARDPGSLAFAQLADLYRKAGRTRDAITFTFATLILRFERFLIRIGTDNMPS